MKPGRGIALFVSPKLGVPGREVLGTFSSVGELRAENLGEHLAFLYSLTPQSFSIKLAINYLAVGRVRGGDGIEKGDFPS